jgi:hypothetical protein
MPCRAGEGIFEPISPKKSGSIALDSFGWVWQDRNAGEMANLPEFSSATGMVLAWKATMTNALARFSMAIAILFPLALSCSRDGLMNRQIE